MDQRRKVPTALGDLSRLEKERKGEREALEQVTDNFRAAEHQGGFMSNPAK